MAESTLWRVSFTLDKKAIAVNDQGIVTEAILLVRPAAGSSWYQELSARFASCVPNKRIRFMDATGKQQKSPVHGNVFFYIGKNVERFREVFSRIGVVVRPFS